MHHIYQYWPSISLNNCSRLLFLNAFCVKSIEIWTFLALVSRKGSTFWNSLNMNHQKIPKDVDISNVISLSLQMMLSINMEDVVQGGVPLPGWRGGGGAHQIVKEFLKILNLYFYTVHHIYQYWPYISFINSSRLNFKMLFVLKNIEIWDVYGSVSRFLKNP